MESQVLIIGAGIFGISTAYHLAKRSSNPSNITILDRASPPSGDAASTDINKIVRADYSSSLYMELGFEAIEAWNNQPLFVNAGVYHQTGWIMMDEEKSDVAERIRANFRSSGQPDPTQDMTEDEVRASWGGVLKDADLSRFGSYYFNPQAGWADAGRALRVMADEVIRMGVRYQVGEASRIVLAEGGVTGVQTTAGDVYTADKVLLSTGAWTSHLMAPVEDELKMAAHERIESQCSAAGVCVAHFQLSEAERTLYDRLPVYVYGGDGEILPPTASGILKFTTSNSFTNTILTTTGHRISVPPMTNQQDVPKSLQTKLIDAIRPRLPQLFTDDRKAENYRLCWDAITPNQHPVITRHPRAELSNLYLAIGGSFHCWKFLPTIGQYVVNILNGTSNGPDRDEAWKWKQKPQGRGVHDKLIPTKALADYGS